MRHRIPHHPEFHEWNTPHGTRYSSECMTCDWTTIKLDDPQRVAELADYHRRHPSE